MSPVAISAVRTIASPYARRLARERGVPLSSLVGSGPGGRIVAGDVPLERVEARVSVAVPVPTPPVAAPGPLVSVARAIGSFAATINLVPLAELSAKFDVALPLGAFLIKAASRAAGGHAALVSWWPASGAATILSRAQSLAPTEIARLIGEGVSSPSTAGRTLELSHLVHAGIRPVSAALAEGADLRLVFSAGDGAASGEALLVFDEGAVSEAEAATILASFRDLIEMPLRLLV